MKKYTIDVHNNRSLDGAYGTGTIGKRDNNIHYRLKSLRGILVECTKRESNEENFNE